MWHIVWQAGGIILFILVKIIYSNLSNKAKSLMDKTSWPPDYKAGSTLSVGVVSTGFAKRARGSRATAAGGRCFGATTEFG